MDASVSPTALAQAEQDLASDPAVSAFVSAHAGTGKTKLLIDRLLRLMMAGADPGRILCLTFTKAAAAEMAIRLQRRLAGFVTLPDDRLDGQLRRLSIAPDDAARLRARALFALVLDLPGGMRISTIHAFCQSLLRRFPLEARISPHFRLMEDEDARSALDRARESMLPDSPPSDVAALAGLVGADDFGALTAELERHRHRLSAALALGRDARRAAFHRLAGVPLAPVEGPGWEPAEKPQSIEAFIADQVCWEAEATLRDALRRCRLHGSEGVKEKAARMEAWMNLPAAERAASWQDWVDAFILGTGKPVAASKFCNPKLEAAHPDLPAAFAAELERVRAILERCAALRCAAASDALLSLAAPILEAFAGEKARGGFLDYDDLIRATVGLLRDSGAAWVKFKLDQDIDHVLLDEVQDTSGAQWDVTDALTEDFFTGANAKEGTVRTVFAVGDVKQSIYSFQGAQPSEFARRQTRYARLLDNAGWPWRQPVLEVSFRSTEPVLRLVDSVFAAPESACGVCGPAGVSHVANRAGQAGSVTVWPLAPRPETSEPPPWAVLDENATASSAADALVRRLADWMAAQLRDGVVLESAGRPMRPGDMLVLVRRRGLFDRALGRELKKRGVPVAGLDRMRLTDQLAVQDLLSLCATLLLPQDDLALAEVLTSPLCGLDDDSLMALAAGRRQPLWDVLRARASERDEWRTAHDFIAGLFGRADFATPYDLLTEALGPLGGRARLFARLGPEAAEPVDELLASAEAYARTNPPSLQGFVHWLERSGAVVKREAEGPGDVVRIMTVHGAKGLEAPVVILPDTTGMPPDGSRLYFDHDRRTGVELFLWKAHGSFANDATERLSGAAATGRIEEYNRLLYVALTRARDHLLICGWQLKDGPKPESWYAAVRRGMTALGATEQDDPWGPILRVTCTQTAAPDGAADDRHAARTSLPAWAGRAPGWQAAPPPREPAVPQPLAPSRPDGLAFGAGPSARSPLLREGPRKPQVTRGLIVHALLQHLPDLPHADRLEAARAHARRAGAENPDALASEVLAVLADLRLAALFATGSMAEQSLSGVVGDQVITGRVDRIAVMPEEVLIADYKTGRAPPASAGDVPVRFLRQMAAYRAVLRPIYPGRTIRCLLIWTEGPAVSALPDAVLDPHAPGRQAA